mmetsp:Transcript_118318/g.339536  ORF Transcript_118318/g.339536 Transcript_118318/m.339536 type:complete len:310 (+) Transcript_118318:165-1094(+)
MGTAAGAATAADTHSCGSRAAASLAHAPAAPTSPSAAMDERARRQSPSSKASEDTETNADGSDATQPTSRPHLLGSDPLHAKLQWYSPPRRKYSRRELLADRIVNFTGAGLSWVAAPSLAYTSWAAGDSLKKQFCFWLHGFGLITMLTCSALYHHWSWDWVKAQQLLSLDHIGISSMIMGSYAPMMFACDCPRTFFLVCSLGVIGWITEAARHRLNCGNGSASWSTLDKLHVVRYLVMGWALVPVLPLVIRMLPTAALWLIAIGGILYTVGVGFFVHGDLEFHLPIWHSKVVLASACFYFANLLVLAGP